MPETDWEGRLSYQAKDLTKTNTYRNYAVPVLSFSVKGGAKRFIYLPSADDISMVSEFEQARTFKNLSVLLIVGENFDWVFDLEEIGARDLTASIQFSVVGRVKNKKTQEFSLACKDVKITNPGETSVNDTSTSEIRRLLRVDFEYPDAKLIHGFADGGNFIEEDW